MFKSELNLLTRRNADVSGVSF